jgi:hypothetical protein
MKRKSLAFAGVGIAVLAGAGYAGNRWIFGKELTPLTAAEIIPQEALVTGYLSTDADNWTQLEGVGIPSNFLKNNWELAQQEMLADTKIDYATDIKPWLGGMAFAIIPSANPQSSEPQFLGILGIKNKLKAYQYFKKVEGETKNIKKTEYRNITIAENQDSLEPSYIALLDDRVMFAANRRVIEKAIDTYKGEPSLVDNEEAKAAFTEQLNLQNSLGQIYLTNYSKLLESVGQSQTNSQLGTLPIFDEVKYMVFNIGTEEQSLYWKSITKLNSERLTQGFTQPSGKLLSQFPENSLSVFNGSNLNQIWTNTTSILAAEPEFNNSLNMLEGGLQMSSGLDLEKDIFGWMDGEYAFGLIPTQTNVIPELGFGLGGAMLFETQQSDVAKKTLARLDDLLESSMGTRPTQMQIRGKTMTQWREPFSGFTLTYGWLDDNSLMFTVGDRVAESLGTKTLTKSSKFDTFSKQLPNDNLGYFYLDMKPVSNVFNNLSDYQKQEIKPEAIELINSLDSIGGTSTMPNSTTIKGDVVIRFKTISEK